MYVSLGCSDSFVGVCLSADWTGALVPFLPISTRRTEVHSDFLTLSAGVSVRRLDRYTCTLQFFSFLVLVSFGSSLNVDVLLVPFLWGTLLFFFVLLRVCARAFYLLLPFSVQRLLASRSFNTLCFFACSGRLFLSDVVWPLFFPGVWPMSH